MSDKLISKELYEAASDAWVAARDRLTDAQRKVAEAERACFAAEEALASQEAYPGIAAYSHAAIPAERCRIGYSCRIHKLPDEGPF